MKYSNSHMGENRLSRFAAGLQEACWLGAACIVPLILNPRGVDLAYQPFKFGIWIMLASIGISAWLVRVASLERHKKSFSWDPLFIVLGLMGFLGLISALLSVDRAPSFWGAPETFQGIATWLAALALAAMVSCGLRTPAQFQRLVSVMILSGFVAGLLAILQRAGFDPNRPELEGLRCHSTAGHSIYLGGYLLMIMPLTLWRLLESRHLSGFSRWAEVLSGVLILAVQVAGLVCAESRGPSLGFCAMLAAFGVFHAVHQRRRVLFVAMCALFSIGAVGIGVVASMTMPEDSKSEVPILRRFLNSKSTEGGIDSYRAEIWKQMPKMMGGNPPTRSPSGATDSLHGLRPLLGYGPETLQCVLPQIWAWELSDKIENRFHNLFWDQLFSYGLAGLAGLIAVLVLTFHSGFKLLGWMSGRRDSLLLVSVICSCGAAGAIIASLAQNVGFMGMGTLFGIAAGMIVFAAIQWMRTPARGDTQPHVTFPPGLLIAILAGLVGHMVDMAFIFHTAPTAMAFWLSVGIVQAAKSFRPPQLRSAPATVDEIISRGVEDQPLTFTMSNVAILALAVVTVLFGCLHLYSFLPMTFGGIFEKSLFQPEEIDGRASLLWMLPVALLLFGGFILAKPAGGTSTSGGLALRVIFPATLVGGIYGVFQISRISAIGCIPLKSAPLVTIIEQAIAYEQLFLIYVAIAGFLLALAAWDLARPYPSHARRVPLRGWLTTALAGVAVAAVCWKFALRPLQANLSSQWAAALTSFARPEFGMEVYRRAIHLDPQPFAYRGLLATSLMDSAKHTQDMDAARVLLAEAEKVLLTGRSISEFNRLHFVLGELYLQRALGEPRPARDETARLAAKAFSMAMAFEPHQEQPWTYASITDRLLLNAPDAADEKLKHVFQLASYAPDVVSANYGALGINEPDTLLRAEFAKIATLHFDRLIAVSNPQGVAFAKFGKARLVLANRGDTGNAEILLREAIPDADPDIRWKANGILAEILLKRGDTQGAAVILKNALLTAPENMRQPITQMIIKLGGTP